MLESLQSISINAKFLEKCLLCSKNCLNGHYRRSPSEVFLGKGVPKICSKFTKEHPCRSAISIKLKSKRAASVTTI